MLKQNMEQFETVFKSMLEKNVEKQEQLRKIGYKEIVEYSTKFQKEWIAKNATAKYQFKMDPNMPPAHQICADWKVAEKATISLRFFTLEIVQKIASRFMIKWVWSSEKHSDPVIADDGQMVLKDSNRLIDIYLTHQYSSPGLLIFLDDLKELADTVGKVEVDTPPFNEKLEFMVKILWLLPIFTLNNLSQLLMLKISTPTIILRAYAAFPEKHQKTLVRPMLAALKTTLRTDGSTKCLEKEEGYWLVYIVSIIKQVIVDQLDKKEDEKNDILDAMVCLRLIIVHKTKLSYVGGSKGIIKLIRLAMKIEPEEALYCLHILWENEDNKVEKIQNEPEAQRLAGEYKVKIEDIAKTLQNIFQYYDDRIRVPALLKGIEPSEYTVNLKMIHDEYMKVKNEQCCK